MLPFSRKCSEHVKTMWLKLNVNLSLQSVKTDLKNDKIQIKNISRRE